MTIPQRQLVAVISNGTAVLGLGNIGAGASKPVMEGKAVLLRNLLTLMVLILNWILKTLTVLLMRLACLDHHLAA